MGPGVNRRAAGTGRGRSQAPHRTGHTGGWARARGPAEACTAVCRPPPAAAPTAFCGPQQTNCASSASRLEGRQGLWAGGAGRRDYISVPLTQVLRGWGGVGALGREGGCVPPARCHLLLRPREREGGLADRFLLAWCSTPHSPCPTALAPQPSLHFSVSREPVGPY